MPLRCFHRESCIFSNTAKEEFMAITIFDANDLKKLILERYDTVLHIHDTCGSLYMNLDEPNKEIEEFITDFFAKNAKAVFSDDGLSLKVQ